MKLSKRKKEYMKTNTELHDILHKKVNKTLRGFNLSYLNYLRTRKDLGHNKFIDSLTLYTNLYNEMFGHTFNSDNMIKQAKTECLEVIDKEHQQLTFDINNIK